VSFERKEYRLFLMLSSHVPTSKSKDGSFIDLYRRLRR